MIIHKSRKKAVCITVAGLLAGIAGGLVLYYVRDVVLGWVFRDNGGASPCCTAWDRCSTAAPISS